MEKKYDENFKIVFEAIKQLVEPEGKPKKNRIGYTVKKNRHHTAERGSEKGVSKHKKWV